MEDTTGRDKEIGRDQIGGDSAGQDLIRGDISGSENVYVGKEIHVHPPGLVEIPRRQGGFMPSVEEEFRKILATHALTLGQLEGKIDRNDMVAKQYVELLREQVVDMRGQLNKLAGMAFIPPSDTEVKAWVPVVTMSALLVIAVGIVALVIILTTTGGT